MKNATMSTALNSYALLASATTFAMLPTALYAQTAPVAAGQETTSTVADPVTAEASAVGNIVVATRRREETSIAAPVAITAVSRAMLEKRGIASVDALARAVPTLITSEAISSQKGGIVAIRGLSGVDANPFGDQAAEHVIAWLHLVGVKNPTNSSMPAVA